MKQAIRAAMRHAQELGVTSVQDNSSREDLEIYQELLAKGELGVRVNAWRSSDSYSRFFADRHRRRIRRSIPAPGDDQDFRRRIDGRRYGPLL